MRLMEVMLRARMRLLCCVCTVLSSGAFLPYPAVGTLSSVHMEGASAGTPDLCDAAQRAPWCFVPSKHSVGVRSHLTAHTWGCGRERFPPIFIKI